MRGLLYMNNYCLLNNIAAAMFKVISGQGLSVFVLALFRNLVLLACSLVTAYYLRKGPF